MGAWSASITGNDTAMDLFSEYTCAFYYYGTNEGVKKIDEYVRNKMCDESDPEEWCDYVYSLADFMWKKGILTDEIKDRALNMIDSGFGLSIWAESGEKVLRQRKKVLEEFRQQLLSPLPVKKKIKPKAHTERIFEDGDIIAIRLITKDKKFASHAAAVSDLSFEDYQANDGKYILIQKVCSRVSWQSSIVPEIKDWWAVFRLFDGVYDDVPTNVNVDDLKEAKIISDSRIYSLFCCESSMFYFKRRKYQVIGNRKTDSSEYESTNYTHIFLGVSNDCWDPDSQFLVSMGRTVSIKKYNGSMERLLEIAYNANRYGAYNYRLSKEENDRHRREEEKRIRESIEQSLAQNADFYTISYGKECGFASVMKDRIDNVFICGQFQKLGLGTELISYISRKTDGQAYMNIPEGRNKKVLVHICEKAGIKVECF
ncbi:MAG: hypothetical protein ACI3XR_10135 [Eubacteriales bacterium]